MLPPHFGTQLAVLVSAALAAFHYANHAIVAPAYVQSVAPVGVGAAGASPEGPGSVGFVNPAVAAPFVASSVTPAFAAGEEFVAPAVAAPAGMTCPALVIVVPADKKKIAAPVVSVPEGVA